LHGSDEGNRRSVIEALPAASLLQTPGARADASTWCDESGHVWLFGGEGFDDDVSTVQPKLINDLWMFNTSRLEWSLVHGSRMHATLSSENRTFHSNTNVGPVPRKQAVTCGVPGIIFVVFGGIDGNGHLLSDTWLYVIQKDRWLPLFWNNTKKAAYPTSAWSTSASWCHVDALYVIGSGGGNVTEMWKLSLKTLEWTRENFLNLVDQHRCTYNPLDPATADTVSMVWNGTFFLYRWQIIRDDSDGSSLKIFIDLQRWLSLPLPHVSKWHSKPFMWSDLNSFTTGTNVCRSANYRNDSSSHQCDVQRCYNIMNNTLWPMNKFRTSSWFYQDNMYIFGGQGVISDSTTYFNDLFVVHLSDGAKSNYVTIILSLCFVLVAFIVCGLGLFCILRCDDYRRGRKKSRELRIHYMPLTDLSLYE